MKQPKNILITGISSGIGRSFIEQVAACFPEAQLIALTRHKPDYALPSNLIIEHVDITDFSKVKQILQKIQKKYGAIDVLINNAGNGWQGTVEDTSIGEAKQQIEVNVWAAMNLIKLVLPGMRAQRSGHIINISSVAADIDYPTMAYYGASKAMLERLSRIVALEVASWNIQVSTICPGAIKTKFGRNMHKVQAYEQSDHTMLYSQWNKRFADMFKQPISSDRVALAIIGAIHRPGKRLFITRRDKIFSYLSKMTGTAFFHRYFIRGYMKTDD